MQRPLEGLDPNAGRNPRAPGRPRARIVHLVAGAEVALPPAVPWRTAALEWLLPSRSMPRRLWPPALGLAYITAVAVLGGLRGDHVLVGLFGFLDLVLGCAYALATLATITALDQHLAGSAGSTMARSLAGGAPT